MNAPELHPSDATAPCGSQTPSAVTCPIPSDVVSVNPGRLTLGALHPEATRNFLRRSAKVLATPTPAKKTVLNFVFACLVPGVTRFGIQLLIFRLLFAAMLIVSGSFILYGEILAPATPLQPEVLAVAQLSIGGMLVFGFLTRFAGFAAAVVYGYLSVTAITAGVFDMGFLALTFSSLVFAVSGGGKFTVDYLIRRSVIHHSLRRRAKLGEERLSYKAYRFS